MKHVAGKVAFITGGASGIGFAMARVFMDAGLKVVIADVSTENLADAKQRLAGVQGQHHLMQLDVGDRAAMAAAADEVERVFGKVHVVCNNAGVGTAIPLAEVTYADWDRMLHVNLHSVINGVMSFLPRIRAHGEGGHIVNTSSMAGLIALPDAGTLYSTAKFAVRGMSESLRLALAADRIGVSLLCPGLTLTRILDAARKESEEEGIDALSAGFVEAQRYAMDPMIVARAVLESIQRNVFYVLPHAEFIDEMSALHEEIIGSFRRDLPLEPKRAEFEDQRRRMIDEIKAGIGKDWP